MMTTPFQMFPNLAHVSYRFRGILLDAYGVFWSGNACGLIPGSREAMEKLVLGNQIVGILSNSTQLADEELGKFERHGLCTNHTNRDHGGPHFSSRLGN
jgi:hypothetical protein